MTDSSPIAVRNKIKAIQSRKPRLTIPTYYDSTEIRPFPLLHSSASFSVITAERLVDRSRAFRQAAAMPTGRPSVLSSTSFASQSNAFHRMPEIPPRRRSRPTVIERHNTLTPIDSTKTNKSPPLVLPGAHLCSQRTHRRRKFQFGMSRRDRRRAISRIFGPSDCQMCRLVDEVHFQ